MRGRPRLSAAFERLRFGPARTLNVRDSLPTGQEAAYRVEQWLRTKQLERPGELLIITGRGASSVDGIGVVREAVARALRRLTRLGVVATHKEHTAGAFVVTVAPLRALLEAPSRDRTDKPRSALTTRGAAVAGLASDTQERLRGLAVRALETLGIRDPEEAMVDAEMARQFSVLARGIPAGQAVDAWLQAAADEALRELDDGGF